ncbi:MAG: hypothetical protein BROFUL_03291 [Candidatus Brocadia fulgida]|uniref:Uncharacterized protein n=1 Tax=Candidatus Brocadia fulgida TaxID=380242 RepID=A0A0M2UPG7_9BACT|nr:MAG: hypothetical protein BROFUL_03291 [Candidatus Brocadia fulgida]
MPILIICAMVKSPKMSGLSSLSDSIENRMTGYRIPNISSTSPVFFGTVKKHSEERKVSHLQQMSTTEWDGSEDYVSPRGKSIRSHTDERRRGCHPPYPFYLRFLEIGPPRGCAPQPFRSSNHSESIRYGQRQVPVRLKV